MSKSTRDDVVDILLMPTTQGTSSNALFAFIGQG